ncbi:MAG: hypothetical protein JXB23_13310 [Candidatus Aminicenantes bacterium]|nr:hypothetical protein [Candidatus Aminicenantes bacterium]
MHKKDFKFLSIVAMALIFYSCGKTIVYFSPYEESRIRNEKKIVVETKKGATLELSQPEIKDQILSGYTKDKTKKDLPFSSIRSVRIEKADKGMMIVYSGVGLVLAWLAIGSATAPEPPPTECCPFIYSFDGENFHLDAEPYGAAICEGLKRTEWSELEHIEEVNGRYIISVANELDETQYTDEITLVVVDHPHDVAVVPDTQGRVHTIKHPVRARRVVNSRNEDVTRFFTEKDGIFWQGHVPKIGCSDNLDLREDLIFEFPKPEYAKEAKLVVNACTSQWGAQMGKRFLSLYGNQVSDWYTEVNKHGPAFYQVLSWYQKQELYLLQIRVETTAGWKSMGTIFGSGPFASKDKAYILDICDIPGETLRIRLTPPIDFWRIDSLAMDYTEDIPVEIHEIGACRAETNLGQDVLHKLYAADSVYHAMPDIGDSFEMTFLSPPACGNSDRTVILKACGYYDIHLPIMNSAPRKDVLDQIYGGSDFTLRFAREEFLKWEAEQHEN